MTTTTCTCSPSLPWYCDACLEQRRYRRAVLARALVELASLRAANDWLITHTHDVGDVIPGTDILNCVCEVQAPLTGTELYRAALARAKAAIADLTRGFTASELRVVALT